MMSALNAMARIESAKTADPVEFLQRMNHRLRKVITRRDEVKFRTTLYVVVNTSEGSIRYSVAGHRTPIVIHADSHEAPEFLKDSGGDTPLEQCLTEAAQAGYQGIELG